MSPDESAASRPPLTDHATGILSAARQDAQSLTHEHVTASHLLLRMATEEHHCVASAVMRSAGIDFNRLRLMIRRNGWKRSHEFPDVDEVLDQASDAARELGDSFVGSEHILIAILRAENVALQHCFRAANVDRRQLEQQILQFVGKALYPANETSKAVALPINPYQSPSAHVECELCGRIKSTLDARSCPTCGGSVWSAVGESSDSKKEIQELTRKLFDAIRQSTSPEPLYHRLGRMIADVVAAQGALIWNRSATQPVAGQMVFADQCREMVAAFVQEGHDSQACADDQATHLFQRCDAQGIGVIHVVQRPNVSPHAVKGNQIFLALVAKAVRRQHGRRV